jgi:ABC-type multidrug transport system fused ATPase/permease subunit
MHSVPTWASLLYLPPPFFFGVAYVERHRTAVGGRHSRGWRPHRLTTAGYAAGTLAESARYVDDYRAFVELLPQVRQSAPHDPAPSSFAEISVKDVTFTYPTGTEPAIRDVSLSIHAGEIVALVGENGSGKTTLTKLLAGLCRPTTGTITWDGTDINGVDAAQLRTGIPVIFQDFVRFHCVPGTTLDWDESTQSMISTVSVRRLVTQTQTDFSPHCRTGTRPSWDGI